MSVIIRDAAGNEKKVAGLGGGGSANAVTVPGGAAITMEEGLGEGPYEFEFTAEEDAPELSASDVSYDNTGSGLAATSVQDAVDEVAASVEAVKASLAAGEVYSTEEVRIGTWVDGEPLYRKTYVLSMQVDASGLNKFVNIDAGWSGRQIKGISGGLWEINTSWALPLYSINVNNGSSDEIFIFNFYTSEGRLFYNLLFPSSWSGTTLTAEGTIEYTKPTDTARST